MQPLSVRPVVPFVAVVAGVALLMVTRSGSLSAVATLPTPAVERPSCVHPDVATHPEGTRMLGRLPVAFVPNLGQWENPARFVTRVGAMTVFLEEKGWTFTLVERTAAKGRDTTNENASARGVAVRMTFAGASAPELAAEDRLPGCHNYFLGNDPSKWRSDVPLYRSVRYREVHPGLDVRAREHDGHFEYDLLLQAGADLEPVEIAVEGAERMHLDVDGALVMETALGPVRMPPPLSWEEGPGGERGLVNCRYVLRGEDRFGFEVIGRRSGWALVVDPGLVWSTFLGGTGGDGVTALALDAQGAVTVAGSTNSSDFPTTPGAFSTTYSGFTNYTNVFVTRLSPTGSSLVYSTFIGGTSEDNATVLALDGQGAATVVGNTWSNNFPTTPGAFDTSWNGPFPGGDAFVTRLSPTGSYLVYSTFLGGSGGDWAYALAIDAQGAATVAGGTTSPNFPTTPGAFDTSANGTGDAFVTKLSPMGSSLVYSTFLGGANHSDNVKALALDPQGAATVAGTTDSSDFPTTPGAFDTSYNGSDDVFVTQLSPTGSSLVYSTFLGGTGSEFWLTPLALDAQGAATVAGTTNSSDFPTTPGAFSTTYIGGPTFMGDAFVTRLSSTGSSLVYSTFLGGAGNDSASALALDAQGAATVAGWTDSANFPTTPGAFDRSYNGGNDAFVTRLSPSGSSLFYSTLLGGAGGDGAAAVALDAQGGATVAGGTSSTDFPITPGALDTSYNNGGDAFITRLDMLPTGVSAYGTSTPGCAGPLPIGVTSWPQVNNASFAFTCAGAPANSLGILGVGLASVTTPVFLSGAAAWIDLQAPVATVLMVSDSVGAASAPLPIPPNPALAGVHLFPQFFWLDGCAPGGVSASNALAIIVQP